MKTSLKLSLHVAFAAGLLVFAGCVVTAIHPWFQEGDVFFEPKLLGEWVDSKDADPTNFVFKFEQGGTNSYSVTDGEDGKNRKYDAHLFRLKQWTFLDAVPQDKCADDFVPPHYLAKVVQIEPTLKLVFMDEKWLESVLQKNPRALAHLPDKQGGCLVLTADTAALQKFLLKHAGKTNAFNNDDNSPLKRRP